MGPCLKTDICNHAFFSRISPFEFAGGLFLPFMNRHIFKGKNIMERSHPLAWNYYKFMSRDPKTGKSLPQTLEELGLKDVIKDLQ
jgi:hypothetical protein